MHAPQVSEMYTHTSSTGGARRRTSHDATRRRPARPRTAARSGAARRGGLVAGWPQRAQSLLAAAAASTRLKARPCLEAASEPSAEQAAASSEGLPFRLPPGLGSQLREVRVHVLRPVQGLHAAGPAFTTAKSAAVSSATEGSAAATASAGAEARGMQSAGQLTRRADRRVEPHVLPAGRGRLRKVLYDSRHRPADPVRVEPRPPRPAPEARR